MANTGAKSPGTAADLTGVGTKVWNNPTYATTDDTADATAAVTDSGL